MHIAHVVNNIGIYAGVHEQKPLKDLIQDFLPNIQKWRFISEIINCVLPFYLIFIFLHKRDLKCIHALKTFLVCHSSLLCLRAASFSFTILPDSSQMCTKSFYSGSCFDLSKYFFKLQTMHDF